VSVCRLRARYPSKAQKRLSNYMFARRAYSTPPQKFYNFLIFNATLQKAHPVRKKA